jgi:hypothetical protein
MSNYYNKTNRKNSTDRAEVEKIVRMVSAGKTNYFQLLYSGLTAPSKVIASRKNNVGEHQVEISWHTSFAGEMPLASYEVLSHL